MSEPAPPSSAHVRNDAYDAIRGPVELEQATVTEDAIDEIYEHTRGSPCFLQEWGSNAWNVADGMEIDGEDAKAATTRSIRKLHESFFCVRFNRLTPAERDDMRCLAELGEGPQRSAEVAAKANKKTQSLAPFATVS